MRDRKVTKLVSGVRTEDGAGVRLTRVLGHDDVRDFDPFLMLDAFDSDRPEDYIAGFPWHPHRGIETVTYLIAGEIDHGDSLGNRGRITDGGCQWMTAGGGILHQEMPQPSKHMFGTQLWINLPKNAKMTRPAYHDISADQVVKVTEDGARIAIVAGEYHGRKAPMQGDFVKTTYLDVSLEPGRTWQFDTPPENTVFLYIMLGAVMIDRTGCGRCRAVLLGAGDRVTLAAGEAGARFLLLSARPLREPIAWGGPIVMNTRRELEQAFRELEEGTFAKGCENIHLNGGV